MDLRFEELLEGMDRLNAALFASQQACVGCIEPEESSVNCFIMSRCGTAWCEIPQAMFSFESWECRVLKSMLSNPSLFQWIGDVSFGSFRKSELYLTLCSTIVLPTQMASGIAYEGNAYCANGGTHGLDAETPKFIITGIQHTGVSSDTPRIESIRGEIPAADEFFIRDFEVPSLTEPSESPIENVLHDLYQRFRSLTDEDYLKVTMQNNQWGTMFDPQTPAELWLMHRAMGTLRRGIRVPFDE